METLPLPVMSLELDGGTVEARVLALWGEHGRRLYGYALGLVAAPADAEDVVQDVFLRLAQHLGRGGDDTNLPAWLFRVTTNLCRDVVRSRVRRQGEPPELAAAAGGDALERIAFQRVLARLDERDRRLVLLRGLGLSQAEMAEVAGIRPSSVGKTLARALDRFIAEYRREGG